jgi:hypothetical protein
MSFSSLEYRQDKAQPRARIMPNTRRPHRDWPGKTPGIKDPVGIIAESA